ncbi:MAG: glycoside hydrolase family 3 protein [Bauldia sp.]|nr:glycoside hydrolase family 3 protein [Bauldia sp.]
MMKLFAAATLALGVATTAAGAQTLDQMAGQMIMVGFEGATVDAADTRLMRDLIEAGTIGGVMYLRRNVQSLDEVAAMNRAFAAAGPGLPPLIALDQEGGRINRLGEAVGFGQIPSAEALGAGTPADAEAIYADLARRLTALGFNVNFGPVVDLDLNPDNPIIGGLERSFGTDPAAVAAFGAAFVNGHHAAGMLTALKHFPGHGSSLGDTHEGFVDVTEVWQPQELEPYRILIRGGLADMVMAAHIYNADYAGDDAVQLPASLSAQWIGGVLRTELGFRGVVISDDLGMGAVQDLFDLRETVIRGVMAGSDILLFANFENYRPGLAAEVHAILMAEAARDPAFAARIAESYGRIAALKARLAGG